MTAAEVLARQLAETAAVAAGLARRCAELEASRLRLMAEVDDAAVRVERDLHDGIQQRLTTAGMEVLQVKGALPDDDPLWAVLTGVGEELGEMAADVRELCRRTFPAILADGGLGPALRSLARRADLPVEVDVPRLGRYPALLEATVYQVVASVVARATGHVSVRIALPLGKLRLNVTHGGGGADLLGPVVRDRLDALGATVELSPTGVVAGFPMTGPPRDTGD